MNFCYKTASIWQLVGVALFILKIAIPLIIIILGSIDLGKAVMSSDDKAISRAAKSLAMRVAAGIIIFFVPTIIDMVFKMVTYFSEEMRNDYANCFDCLTDPYNSCDTSYKGEIFK